MSTYAIADAINKLADNIKYAIGARNQIEKDKLAFEKEKFEFKKEKEKCKHKEECEHEYELIGCSINSDYVVNHYTCSKCGKKKSMSLGI